ncbi:MAG: phosphoribosylamine--glycine ligase [Bacteroidetes bacterium]|nr:phosphoribosylamine--glycine ligase [Bacteroidota bacterium]
MNILILGTGAREHVFAWKISQSPLCTKLYIASGNAGTAQYGTNINISPTDFESIKVFCIEKNIELVIPGNEDPLVLGITDYLEKEIKNIKVAGPSKKGAQLEGSKDFAKEFMIKHNIPTARFSTFTKSTINQAYQFLETLNAPYVLKADGLAAGKGVLICGSLEEAKKNLYEMLENNKFGKASEKVVIEEFLTGIELSCFALTDGKNYVLLPEAKDYKRIGEGDTGLNTGGMGAVSPVPFANKTFMYKVVNKIIKPTIAGIKKDKLNYKGFIFFGLINYMGEPYVIEYNARMGDPETEVVIPRVENDLVELLLASCTKSLDKCKIKIKKEYATTVFTVSGGYPEEYKKGMEITGFEYLKDCIPFHAGTQESDGKIVTSGGRVIAFTALDNSLLDALLKSYKAAHTITFQGKYYRTDIGKDLLDYL